MEEQGHIPVLLGPVVEGLRLSPGMTVIDCTLGLGGHASAIAAAISPGGWLIGLDVDAANVAYVRNLAGLGDASEGRGWGLDCRCDFVHASFADVRSVARGLGVERVDGLLADLGFCSTQMDDGARGFSFQQDGPLDMRLDRSRGMTAWELVNSLPERELADLLYTYGEERRSRAIARKIVAERKSSPIMTTASLAKLVRDVLGGGHGQARRGKRSGRRPIDPATRTFMALRIAVNGELEALDRLLSQVPGLVRPDGGVAAIISFHSLEDRRVKQAMTGWQTAGRGKRRPRKPIIADEAETASNPRSRSAKLRLFVFEAASQDATTGRRDTDVAWKPEQMRPHGPPGS